MTLRTSILIYAYLVLFWITYGACYMAHGPFPPADRASVEDGNLTIQHLSVVDQGGYECIATNVVTSIIATTLLIIELTLHHEAYNLTADTSETTAHIFWFPAYSAGQQHHYVLWFRAMVGIKQDWETICVSPNETSSVTIYNLLPDTTYQFMVLARTQQGEELFSGAQVIVSTKPGISDLMESSSADESKRPQVLARPTSKTKAPPIGSSLKPAPPINITATYLSAGLNITWSAPPTSPLPIRHYTIEYRTVGQWVPLTETLFEHNETSYNWKTPSRGAVYQFRLFSLDKTKTPSDPSHVIFVNTGSNHSSSAWWMSSSSIVGLSSVFIIIIAAALALVVAFRFFLAKRKRDKNIPYGNVKYFGPNNNCTSQSQISTTGSNQCHVLPPPPPPAVPPTAEGLMALMDPHENHVPTPTERQLLETLI